MARCAGRKHRIAKRFFGRRRPFIIYRDIIASSGTASALACNNIPVSIFGGSVSERLNQSILPLKHLNRHCRKKGLTGIYRHTIETDTSVHYFG
jgi:hypothetical protein